MERKYHSPKEYLDAANSPETSSAELAFLAKSEYGFAQRAVAGNSNTTSEILAVVVPNILDDWDKQYLARILTQNSKTPSETLSLLGEKLIPFLDNGRNNDMALEAGKIFVTTQIHRLK